MLLALEMEECGQPLDTGKGKEINSPQSHQKDAARRHTDMMLPPWSASSTTSMAKGLRKSLKLSESPWPQLKWG